MNTYQIILSILVGVGLSAACGFRIFVPLLIVSIAGRAGDLAIVGEGFEWLYSDVAIIALSLATLLEIVGYYVPCVDNFLDVIGAPAAIIAGTILTASFATDVAPWLQWSLGVICGGGAAGVVHAGMATARGIVTTTTAGIGNGLVSTGETAVAAGTSVLAIVAPVAAAVLVILLMVVVFYFASRKLRRRLPVSSEV